MATKMTQPQLVVPTYDGLVKWSIWCDMFDCWTVAVGVPKDKLVCTFLAAMGSAQYALVTSLVYPTKPQDCTLVELKDKLGEQKDIIFTVELKILMKLWYSTWQC